MPVIVPDADRGSGPGYNSHGIFLLKAKTK